MTTNLAEYISVGYYVTCYVPRPKISDLLPEKILSGSDCICAFLPDVDMNPGLEDSFGLEPDDLDRLKQWSYERKDEIKWPNVLLSPRTAQDLVRNFLAGNKEAAILGFGLHSSLMKTVLAGERGSRRGGTARGAFTNGLMVPILGQETVAPGGCVLGFEPRLLISNQLNCSWLCNNLERECQQALGIVPNEHGFLSTFAEATRCTRHIIRDDVPSEPGEWLPLLVIKYPRGS